MRVKKLMLIGMFLFAGNSLFAQDRNVGGDKDSHGCYVAAGYTWSVVKKECIRVFELPIKLDEVNPKGSSTTTTGVAFSDDMKKAEIFTASEKSSVILIKTGKVWKKGLYTLSNPSPEKYILKKGKKIIFKN